MKKIISISALILCFTALISCGNGAKKESSSADAAKADTTAGKYVCPMDSDVVSAHAGTCPKCGMELEKAS